jgi:hypothetical protein
MSASKPVVSMAPSVRVFSVLVVASLTVLSACSGGTPKAAPAHVTTTGPSTTTVPAVAACAPSSVSATVSFTKFGGTSSALAGAVLFQNTSTAACALHGVPRVQVVTTGGVPIPIYQAMGPASTAPAVLNPASAGTTGTEAASSITFSSWLCDTNTFSLTIRFPGWTSSVTAAPNATSGTNSTTPCSPSNETGETLYMGPVASVG